MSFSATEIWWNVCKKSILKKFVLLKCGTGGRGYLLKRVVAMRA